MQNCIDDFNSNLKPTYLKCVYSFVDVFHQAKGKMGGLNVVCNNAALNVVVDERDRFDEMISVNLVSNSYFQIG